MSKEVKNPVQDSYGKIVKTFNKAPGKHTWSRNYRRANDARATLARLEGKFKVVATSIDVRDCTTSLRYYPKDGVYVLFDEFSDESANLSIKAKSLKKLAKYSSAARVPETPAAS